MKDKGFTFNLKIDFFDASEEDALLAKEPTSTIPGSFWQWSVGEIKDAQGTILNTQSVLQRDVMVKHGGLKFLIRDIQNMLPRFLDENGLRST